MAFSTAWRDNFVEGYDHGRSSGAARPQRLFGGTALTGVAFACAFALWVNLAGSPTDRVIERVQEKWEPVFRPDARQTSERVQEKWEPVFRADARQTSERVQEKWEPVFRPDARQTLQAEAQRSAAANRDARLVLASSAYAKLAAALTAYARRSALAQSYARLFDSHYLGAEPEPFTALVALPADSESAEVTAAVATTPDLAISASIDRQAAPGATSPAQKLHLTPARTAALREAAPAAKPSIFEKLFGKPAPLTLAYAAPDDGDLGAPGTTGGRYDRWTAVYDVSAHTVYMPDGTELEAHSGFGNRLDDPRHTDERMRGATPAAVYDLRLRESPFHGVQALRLIPLDTEKVFGRSGLLAHTYMLGPNGDSNGCVSFRNYNAFLQAYLDRRIKRLAVVTRLD